MPKGGLNNIKDIIANNSMSFNHNCKRKSLINEIIIIIIGQSNRQDVKISVQIDILYGSYSLCI